MAFALCVELPVFVPVITVYMLQIVFKTNFLATNLPPSSLKQFFGVEKKFVMELYLHSPVHLHGMVHS
jgi:hypothetical protein